jgi:hypothetical protein
MTSKLICPKCKGPAKVDPDPSYYGEMFQCTECGFRAYFDTWNDLHNGIPESNDPF